MGDMDFTLEYRYEMVDNVTPKSMEGRAAQE